MAVINGTAGDDSGLDRILVRGGPGADTLNMLGGQDALFGNGGDDTASGGEGNDRFVPGVFVPADPIASTAQLDLVTFDGADLYDGGAGGDTVFFSYAPLVGGVSALVTVDLASGTGRGGNQEGDRYRNIETVTVLRDDPVGSAGRARLVGSAGNDSLRGGPGDDIVEGRGGGDLLSGGQFNARVDAGFDTVSYRSSPAGVTIDLSVSSQVSGGDARGDQLFVLDFDAVIGSDLGDVLRGGNAAERFDGANGSDLLEGRLGDDTYVVSAGPDVIRDIGGNDRIEAPFLPLFTGRVGDDLILDFGPKIRITVDDHFVASGLVFGAFPTAVETLFVPSTGQTLVLATSGTGGPESGIVSGNDEDETLDGAGGDDLVFGNDGADIVIGGEGDDILAGGKGPDLFLVRPGDGNDLITDFTVRGKNADKLDLTAFGFESADDVLAGVTRVEGKTVLTLAEDQTITFERLGGRLGLANLILEAEA